MVFNIIARNQDDHAKNFSFIMDKQGSWSISPAYDITYVNGKGYTKEHQLSLKGQTTDFERKMLVDFAVEQSIRKQDALHVINEVQEVLSTFSTRAKELEVNKESIERIAKAHLLKI